MSEHEVGRKADASADSGPRDQVAQFLDRLRERGVPERFIEAVLDELIAAGPSIPGLSAGSIGHLDRVDLMEQPRGDIHAIVREPNAVLGPTIVAGLAGSKDRKLPDLWARPDGPGLGGS